MDFLKSAVSQFSGSENSNQDSQQPNSEKSNVLNAVEDIATQADPDLKPYENIANDFLGGGRSGNKPTNTSTDQTGDGYDQQSSQPQDSNYADSDIPKKTSAGGGGFGNQGYGDDQSTYDGSDAKPVKSSYDQDSDFTPVKSSGYGQGSDTYGQDSDSAPVKRTGYGQGSDTYGQDSQDNYQKQGDTSEYNQDSTNRKGSDSYDTSADTDSTYQQPSSKTESYDDSSYQQQSDAPARGGGSAGYDGQSNDSSYQSSGQDQETTKGDKTGSYGDNSGYDQDSGYGKPSRTSNDSSESYGDDQTPASTRGTSTYQDSTATDNY